MLLARRDEYDVPGADLLHLAAAAGDIADAVGDVQGLPSGVGVPGGAGTGAEPDVGAAEVAVLAWALHGVDVDGAGDPVHRSAGRLAAALDDLHDVSPWVLSVVADAIRPRAPLWSRW